ncbi:MAG: stage V sporulation protein SpoVM [Eubacteriales bacterium]
MKVVVFKLPGFLGGVVRAMLGMKKS